MKKRTTLLLSLATAAILAGSAWGAETAAPAASEKAPALSAPPVFSSLSSASTTAATGAVKVGYVDLTRVAVESETGKAARAELVAKTDKLRAKLEAKQKQLEKQKKEIEAKLPTYTPQQREAKAKEFQKKVEEYQKLLRSTEQELQGAEEKVKAPILKSIKDAAADYGARNGFAVVVVREQMLYLSDSAVTEDITDKVTKAIDQKKGDKK